MFDPKTAWKSSPNRSKTTPRGYFCHSQICTSILDRFSPKMLPFGHPFCSKNRTKIQEAPKTLPRRPKKPPRGRQEGAKRYKKEPFHHQIPSMLIASDFTTSTSQIHTYPRCSWTQKRPQCVSKRAFRSQNTLGFI